jgi:hypothetical protein
MSGEKYAFMNKSEVLWFFGALVAVVGFLALFTKNPAQEARYQRDEKNAAWALLATKILL